MFANALHHPSTPVSFHQPAAAAQSRLEEELPTLLRQSLMMWEQVFLRQGSAQQRHASAEAAATTTDATSGA